MQAIRTQYVGATDTKPSRIRAACAAKAIMVSYDHGLDIDGNHKAAAYKLRDLLNWEGEMISGTYKDDQYWVFVPKAA